MSTPALLVVATAFGLGARHGLDWDHLAALADLVGSGGRARRSVSLALCYCVGHGSVIVALGLLVGLVGVRLPDGLDRGFEVVVGVTLIGLGALVLGQVAREGRRYRLTSRWRLALGLLRRPWARARSHEPDGPAAAMSGRLAFGVGVLHGTGAETPTQVVLFATAATAGSTAGALLVLGAFVAGLVASDAAVALAWVLGRTAPARLPLGQLALGVATGVASVGVGWAFVLRASAVLPSLLG